MNRNHPQDTSIASMPEIGVERVGEELHPQQSQGRRSLQLPGSPRGLLFSVDPPPNPSAHSSPSPRSRPLPQREPAVDSRVMPATIPPVHDNRLLILCLDGTGNQFDSDNSNIVNFCSLLKKDDRSKQMVYYQSGVGTYTSPKVATPKMSKVTKALDLMMARHLSGHVMDAYEFLMQNYTAGDRICIFGFSRGAYIARSLAGMLHKVGLLPADNFQQVPFAYRMYTRVDRIGWEQSTAFKEAFCREVSIDFLGVWDTVDSVGLIPSRLPFTTSNTIVRTFRHALSLDERRAKFKPNLWNLPHTTHQEAAPRASAHTHRHRSSPSGVRDLVRELSKSPKKDHSPLRPSLEWDSTEDNRLSDFEEQFSIQSEHNSSPTDVKEVWFAGCHCDVGGGSVKNSEKHSLARISLRWMIRECFLANTGIMFRSHRLKSIGMDPTTLYPFVTPRPPPLSARDLSIDTGPEKKSSIWHRLLRRKPRKESQQSSGDDSDSTGKREDSQLDEPQNLTEEMHDLRDSLSRKYDQLKIVPLWWLLEVIPMEFRYQKKSDEWISYFGFNYARPRLIPEQESNGIFVHRSVKTRMEAQRPGKHCGYSPKAKFDVERTTWVD